MTENLSLSFNLYNYHQKPAAAAPPDSRRSRWNPTPEQLMSLKELYRCGIKTPTAQQIRQVTAMLRRFGKVEGKNVFYWFQNSRARERQKIRREMAMTSHSRTNEKPEQRQNFTKNLISSLRNKASAQGLRRTSLEVEQQNKWTPHSNFTTRSDQESSSVMQERMSMVKSHSSQAQCINAPVIPLGANLLDCDHCGREIQTLELFPLQSDNLKGVKVAKLPMIGTGTKDIIPNFRADRYLHLF